MSGAKEKKQRSKEKAKPEEKEKEKKSNKSRSEGEGEEPTNKIKRRRSFRLSRGATNKEVNKAFAKEEEKAKEKESKQKRLSKSTSAIASAALTDRHVKSDGDEPEKGGDKSGGSRIHHKKKAGQEEGEVSKKKSTQVVDKEPGSSSFVTAADSSDNKDIMEKDRGKRKSKSDDEWERVKRLIDEAEAQKGRAVKEAEVVDEAVAYYAQKAETPRKDGTAASSFAPASSSSSSSRKRLTVSLGPGASPRSNAMGSNRMNTNARRVSNELNIKVQQFNIEKEGVFKSFKYQQLPPLRVKPLSSQSNVIELFGPSDEPGAANRAEMLPSGDVYCRAISTYPWDMHASAQAEKAAAAAVAADPAGGLNTNWSQVFEGVNIVSSADGKTKAGARPKVFANRTLVALADGCNWGEKPKKAAQTACQAFLEHMKSKFGQVNDIKTAGHYMLRALAHAHTQIMNTCARDAQASGKTMKVTDGGTTTLLGGILLELEESEAEQLGSQWVFVCVSVGDCKAYLYSPSSRQVIDVTRAGNRSAKADMSDPGGRLGPTVGRGGDADLRNLGLYMAPCEEDSLLLVVSDGVHDNLDPEHLGLSPNDVGVDQDKWDSNFEALEKAKHLFRSSCLMQKIRGSNEEVRPTPEDAVNRLLDHCKHVTQRSRQWMMANPTRRLPNDHINFPGKMDHTSCIAVTVGRRQQPKEGGSSIIMPAPVQANTPITVTVAQNEQQVAVVCRTLLINNLSCSVQGRKIEFTLRNPDATATKSASIVPSGFRVVGDNEVEAKKWKRVVDLPCRVALDSQQTKQLDDHTILFTFTKAL
ncbi:protein phosphatase 2c-related protein [Acanthamoeba castellanii str. Neff]|uniref:Protein phosphatase 2c-related protein n=1 Tax=Acanthamoeba castellanii (strain ATCC 30010 / Neff) TaxID=1257118 RepID=L8GL94_ACACF|nr:protein phosphatase 2c-related protein [Acanthamoeba castellanii str. Neff]ELR13488.1 protein phosphatase 2c-related protein [Acanthamoeba castellanii str. Neff]